MLYNELGRTGLRVSALGFGAAPAGYLGVDIHSVKSMLETLKASGVNVIDTAECYADAEEKIGQAIAGERDHWVIITKCGHAVEGDEHPDWSSALIRNSVDRSLRRLRTERIDVILLHSCSLEILERGDVLAELGAAKRAGKVRFIGYSGDNEAAEHAARSREVDVIEISVNICDQHNIDAVLPIAQAQKTGVVVKRPLANAAWKPLAAQPGGYAEYARPYSERFSHMGLQSEVDSDKWGTWPEIAIRFSVFTPGVHTAVVGSTSKANLEANVRAIAQGPLQAELYEMLRERFRTSQHRLKQSWMGET